MNLDERFPVSPAKREALITRIRALGIDPKAIEEEFSRGGGPGGQKTNKTSNGVRLVYPPLGLEVRCREARERSLNRFLALRELVERAEAILSPSTSPRLRAIERRRNSKARASRRARSRHRPDPAL